MSLKVRNSLTFAVTVHVSEPGDVPDEVIEGTFAAWFKHVEPKRFAELCDELRAVSSGPDEARFRALASTIRSAQGDALKAAVADLVELIQGTSEPVTVSAIFAFRTRLLDEVLDRVEGIGDDAGQLPAAAQVAYVKGRQSTAQAAMDKFFATYQDARAGNLPRSAAR
ncbi:MAG: hypothetical protein U1F26_10885 [Lysobacterales bacterium]